MDLIRDRSITHTIVTDSVASHIVTTAAHCHSKLIHAGKLDGTHHIGDPGTPHNKSRSFIDCAINHSTSGIEITILRKEKFAAQAGSKVLDSLFLEAGANCVHLLKYSA